MIKPLLSLVSLITIPAAIGGTIYFSQSTAVQDLPETKPERPRSLESQTVVSYLLIKKESTTPAPSLPASTEDKKYYCSEKKSNPSLIDKECKLSKITFGESEKSIDIEKLKTAASTSITQYSDVESTDNTFFLLQIDSKLNWQESIDVHENKDSSDASPGKKTSFSVVGQFSDKWEFVGKSKVFISKLKTFQSSLQTNSYSTKCQIKIKSNSGGKEEGCTVSKITSTPSNVKGLTFPLQTNQSLDLPATETDKSNYFVISLKDNPLAIDQKRKQDIEIEYLIENLPNTQPTQTYSVATFSIEAILITDSTTGTGQSIEKAIVIE